MLKEFECPECDALVGDKGMMAIWFHSGMTMHDGRPKPFVHFAWGEMRGELTPEASRQHALSILECAEAADCDGYIAAWAHYDMHMPPQTAAMMLTRFHTYRSKLGGT